MTGDSVNNNESAETPISLLLRVKQFNQAAWSRLVELYSPLVFHWCRQGGLQPADAADIGQEVFQVVARCIVDFRRERKGDTFRGWLRRITQNKVRDHFRSRKARAREVHNAGVFQQLAQWRWRRAEPSDAPAPSERIILLRRALDVIRPEVQEKTWKAFWQVVIEERSPADVAVELDMSLNAVYLARSHMLRRIRDEFLDLEDPDISG